MARRKVALLIESSRAYGRGLLKGITRYQRVFENWSVSFAERTIAEAPPSWWNEWRGDGVIARIETKQILEAVQKLGVPTVDVRGRLPTEFPSITTDDPAISELAFSHLRERGFRQFGFCGFHGADYSTVRLERFESLVSAAGESCPRFLFPAISGRVSPQKIERSALKEEAKLVEWLRELPKPAGIMVCNDSWGLRVLAACRAADILVPDQVSIIGVDNDELLCELSDPPLSSIEPDTETTGYEAAAMLDKLMNGESLENARVFVPPQGVITRKSTDVLAIDDPDVAMAVRLIREHACQGIRVRDVVNEIPLSRRVLERRFRELFGISPHDEITRVRCERIRKLLVETDLTMYAVARLGGFQHAETFTAFWSTHFGMPPAEYRRKHQ